MAGGGGRDSPLFFDGSDDLAYLEVDGREDAGLLVDGRVQATHHAPESMVTEMGGVCLPGKAPTAGWGCR